MSHQKAIPHSFLTPFLLFLAVVAGSVVGGMVVESTGVITPLDLYFYHLLSTHHTPLVDFLVTPVNYNLIPGLGFIPGIQVYPTFLLIYLGIFLISLFFLKRALFIQALFIILLGTGLSLLITWIDWTFVYRDRPFLVLPTTADQLSQHLWAQYSSFPSGHSRDTALYSTIIAHHFPKVKMGVFLFTIFVALSRVYLGAHYPTDVIAGVIIGYLVAKTSIATVERKKV